MKFKNLLLIFMLSLLLNLHIIWFSLIEFMTWVWLLILIFSYKKMENHYISLLLILEMLSLMSLFLSSIYMKYSSILILVFILMTLSVGEATLGLAILVKLARHNHKELLLSSIY